MNSIILHISDLHVSLDKKIGGAKNDHDSYLTTKRDEESATFFVDKFIATIEKDYKDRKIYLLITGDTANTGEKKEFQYASKFLKRIIERLKIDKNHILLIPGDHDLNRRSIENLLADDDDRTIEEINEAKFDNFSHFYSDLLGKDFDSNKVIFDYLLVDESILVLGVNSCTQLDLVNKLGKVPTLKFEDELEELSKYKNVKKIVCFHHNLTSSYENNNDGQWDSDNRESFLAKLMEVGIEFIFTGNEHTNSTKSLFLGTIWTSDSGCLTTIKYDTTFKVYEVVITEDIILKNNIYSLQKTNNNDSSYEWDKRTNEKFHQPNEYKVFTKEPPKNDSEIIELPESNNESNNTKEKSISDETEKEEIYINKDYTDVLYEKVKSLNLFHSGHFHWSESSRAHNWIDTSKLIEKKEDLSFTKNAIVDVIEKKGLDNKIDLIIGLGYEGNIIASKATIKFNKPYAFLPYSYRSDEHHEYEKELNFENDDSKYKNVLIITDVVNDGRTIRKLIKNKYDSFFKNVAKVYVISLFYTGESKLDSNILNFDFIKTIPNYNLKNDEDVNNIEFYTVKSLKVEKCPYGDDFRETCSIVKDGLDCVNLFYDESKFIKKPTPNNGYK